MSFRIYVIRHGEPQSGQNPPLSDTGHIQADRVGQKMKEWGIDVLYSSCYQRAVDTASHIHRYCDVNWHLWPALAEAGRRGWPQVREMIAAGQIRAGELDESLRQPPHENYVHTSKLAAKYSQVITDQPIDWEDEWWMPTHNETREFSYERARLIIEEWHRRYMGTGKTIAVACHAAFGSILLTVLLGCPPSDISLFSFTHAAIAKVDISDECKVLDFSNYTRHIEDCMTEG